MHFFLVDKGAAAHVRAVPTAVEDDEFSSNNGGNDI